MKKIQKFIDFITKEQIIFKIGKASFLYYGLIISITLFFGYFFGTIFLQIFQINFNIIPFWIVFSIPSVIIFSRLLPLILSPREFISNPKGTFNKKWFSYFGGFIGFMVSSFLVVWYFKGSFLRFSDALVLALPFAHMFGRLASINYGCCGIGLEKKSKKGLHFFYRLKNKSFVPIHLYEIGLNFILGIILVSLLFFVNIHGLISGVYLVGYALIRIVLEPLRLEDQKILFGKYSLYQIILAISFISAGIIYFVLAFTKKVLIVLNFNVEYIFNSLAFIPLIFLMSVVAFICFGMKFEDEKDIKQGRSC